MKMKSKEKKQMKKQVKKEKDTKSKKRNVSTQEPNYQMDTKPTMWDIISPDGLKIDSEDHGLIKQSLGTKTYFRPFFIPRDGYPRTMATNWLYDITSSGEVDIYLDIHKVNKSDAIRTLQRQITMLESNLSFQTKEGI